MPVYGLEKSGANNCPSENISNIKAQKTSLRSKSIVLFYSIVFLHFQQEFSRFSPTKNDFQPNSLDNYRFETNVLL